MPAPAMLLERLNAIGRSLEQSGHALALIGLGSVGVETERLDEYSDLDFFVIVEDGYKSHYIEDLGWISSICPIAYAFRNTADGYKLLFQDDIFCELAVFERPELSHIPFATGRIVWKQPHIDEAICVPAVARPPSRQLDVEWAVGEALTNLYVGLGRYRRGEKLSAMRFIQHYAVDRILDLAGLVESESSAKKDEFSNERRFEQRHPQIGQKLARFTQGYERSCESAQEILEFLEEHFDVNQAIANKIRQSIDHAA